MANDLIVDFRGINELKDSPYNFGCHTFSSETNQSSGVTGSAQIYESLARAGIIGNVDGIFLETHSDPSSASDGANMLM